MDETDIKILNAIQDNARISNADLARELGMAPSGMLDRVKRLEKKGVIKGYTTQLEPEALDLKLLAFLLIRSTEKPGQIGLAQRLAQAPEVLEVHHVAGEDCYLLKVRARDTQSLAAWMRATVGAESEVLSTKTLIVFETIKEQHLLPLPKPA